MEIPKSQSAGGKATAILFRKKAIERYYQNPIICKNCNKMLPIRDIDKVSLVLKKKFCNSSCSVSYNNRERIKKEQKPKTEKLDIISNLTKDELFSRYSTYQSARSMICKHARRIFFKSRLPKECKVCSYDTHIDIAHIKSVSSFDGLAKISDINNIANLYPLCPNHHWEFDAGLIEIA